MHAALASQLLRGMLELPWGLADQKKRQTCCASFVWSKKPKRKPMHATGSRLTQVNREQSGQYFTYRNRETCLWIPHLQTNDKTWARKIFSELPI